MGARGPRVKSGRSDSKKPGRFRPGFSFLVVTFLLVEPPLRTHRQIAQALRFVGSAGSQVAIRAGTDPPIGFGFLPLRAVQRKGRCRSEAEAEGRLNNPNAPTDRPKTPQFFRRRQATLRRDELTVTPLCGCELERVSSDRRNMCVIRLRRRSIAHFSVARGGHFVSPQRWLDRLQSSCCRVEFRPDDRAPLLGGEVWVRFGHPEVADNRELLLLVDVNYTPPAKGAPEEVVDHCRAKLARLRELDAPTSLIVEAAIHAEWLTRGQPGVLEALGEIIDERQRRGDGEDLLRTELELLEYWSAPDAHLPQMVTFRGVGGFFAKMVAQRLLASTYAVEAEADADGEVPWSSALATQLIRQFREAQDKWGWSDAEAMRADEYFAGWDKVPLTDPEDDVDA
jgi:hypothetical protein